MAANRPLDADLLTIEISIEATLATSTGLSLMRSNDGLPGFWAAFNPES